MPLDDREQRILEEIERQFYQEDPKLAQTVRRTTLATVTARRVRWASVALVVGLAVMLVFFTRNSFVALAGFLVMVVAGGWMVSAFRGGRGGGGLQALSGVANRARRRWRRDG
ncbi:MAG: DUF3040 domain-containing protein [Acidimicrobiia bacterium]|nr:DUF3040 domain-containing protein [Acidimicrobiia bacterium]MDH3470258.1 DUF3040 domain-containing protein [Acidimicrobiia bacterium]